MPRTPRLLRRIPTGIMWAMPASDGPSLVRAGARLNIEKPYQ